MRVAVVGAAGRMGHVVASAVVAAEDMELGPLVDVAGGESIATDVSAALTADVVVDFTHPGAVAANLPIYRSGDVDVVVGTSGFDEARLTDTATLWEGASSTCLVVPNFSIGAVLMMRMAREAAPHFGAAEVIELHHDNKVDAPSGTALATAEAIAAAGDHARQADADDLSRGRRVGDVNVHAVRLPGLLAHQEVLMGNPGEVLTIRHDTTDRQSFVPGILLAIRSVGDLPAGLSVGLEQLL